MLKCYIVDDEQNAVDAMSAMLRKKFSSQITICGSNIGAYTAIEEIENTSPDIVFLDVEMPELNGLELLKHFPERKFHVIFTTAHEKYALQALKAAATDYLVKPISPQDMHDAIQKCSNLIMGRNEVKSAVTNKISIATSHEVIIVNVSDIIHIEANNNYSHFHFINRPKLIVSKTLKEYEELLAPYNFIRIHQSHLINKDHVESVKTNDGDYVMLTKGHRVEISRRRKVEFLQKLKQR